MSQLFLTIFILISFVSCGLPEEKNDVGDVRKFEPVSISESEYKRVLDVCNALKEKESILQQMVDNRVPFAFNYGEKTCAEEKISSVDPVTVRIKNYAQDFQFDAQGGKFGYLSVETSKVGLMVDVCNNLATKVSPIVGASGSAIWFASINSSRHCQSAPGATCMLVEFGRKADDYGNYQIHTREWVKFVTTRGNSQGFFSERKTFSSVGCAQGLQFERMAVSI